MPARAMWKGIVRIAELEVPIKLYAALEDRALHFRLLHRKDGVPVRQKLVDAESGKEVATEAIRKGIEIEGDGFIPLEEEDLARLEPEASRVVAIERFVDAGRLQPQWYDRPYFAGPDGDEAAYWSLVAALEEEGKEGIARWVMRGKEYLGSLAVRSGYLTIVTLRFAEEVIAAGELGVPEVAELNPAEIKLAAQLMSTLEEPFDPLQYNDEHREKVLQWIHAKASGARIQPIKAARRSEVGSLAGALRNSIAEARKRKHA